jgi:hypothetical protein
MGWPIGWTDCESLATGSCHLKPLSLGASSGIDSMANPEVA